MNTSNPITLDLADLRRLLRDSERDIAALSREESERILSLPDPALRLREYMNLRETWARSGDRLLPEHEARIQASLATVVANQPAPLPQPPVPRMPLTPINLLSWASQWRLMLVDSGLRRAAADGQGMTLAEFEALANAQDDFPQTERLPEIALLRLLEALTRELQDGLETRLLLRDEALSGHVGNLPGLLRNVVATKSRRIIPVPAVPSAPGLRSSIGEILAWLENLLAFEEAVGARALLQAGVVVESVDAAAHFRAAARQGGEDVQGHAASQLASWRRADRAHRAAAAAQRAGWLSRDRIVVLPSFEVDELERWFAAFTVPAMPAPPPPATARPAAVQLYWAERRRQALRRIALTLLAEGAVPDLANADHQAVGLAARASGPFAQDGAEVQQAEQVIGLCERLLARGSAVSPVRDAGSAEAVLAAWAQADLQGGGLSRATPAQVPLSFSTDPATLQAAHRAVGLQPRHQVAEDAQAASAPPRAIVAEALPASGASVVAEASSPVRPAGAASELIKTSPKPVSAESVYPEPDQRFVARRRISEAIEGAGVFSSLLILGLGSCLLYQAAMVAQAGAAGGVQAAVSEMVLRSALLGDPMWFASGVILLLAVLLLLTDLRRLPSLIRGRGWRAGTILRLIVAGGLVAGHGFLDQPLRFSMTGAGIPSWPERVVDRGGVPTSTLNVAEGTWLARRVVEPMRADDLPPVQAGQPPLVLLREVGFFGVLRNWWIADAPDAVALAGQPVEAFREAPSAVGRKNPSP